MKRVLITGSTGSFATAGSILSRLLMRIGRVADSSRLGMTKREAAWCMKLASIPEDVFEAAVADRTIPPTNAAFLRKCEELMAQKREGEVFFRD